MLKLLWQLDGEVTVSANSRKKEKNQRQEKNRGDNVEKREMGTEMEKLEKLIRKLLLEEPRVSHKNTEGLDNIELKMSYTENNLQ